MSKFQKDLYEKKGSLFTALDFCVGAGLVSLLSGLYLNHKDKKLLKQQSTEPKKMSLPGIGLSAPLGENTFARKKDSPGPKTSGGTMGAVYGHDSKNPSATNRKGSTNTEDALQKLGI